MAKKDWWRLPVGEVNDRRDSYRGLRLGCKFAADLQLPYIVLGM